MEAFLATMSQLLGCIGVVYWVIMLIDCFGNKTLERRSKILWGVFIFLTQWIGATVYLFVVRVELRTRVLDFIKSSLTPKTATFNPPPKFTPPYYEYQQGYQGYQAQQSYQQSTIYTPSSLPQQHAADSQQYEQPQASYPEMPPM